MLTEEEGFKMRHYIDEPNYNDLHWVRLTHYHLFDGLESYVAFMMLDTILITTDHTCYSVQ